MKTAWYVVQIKADSVWHHSRAFTTLQAARKWAKRCAVKWPTQIYRGGPGGEEVPVI